jgi:hypothetical protein
MVVGSVAPLCLEMGFFRILAGHNSLGIEMEVAWATPGAFTVHNYPCYEDGANCAKTQYYEDPSKDVEKVRARLLHDKRMDEEAKLRRRRGLANKSIRRG